MPRLAWDTLAPDSAVATSSGFARTVTRAVLSQDSVFGGKEYGWWRTRRASADLSIFPGPG
jgi:hypothetical protein